MLQKIERILKKHKLDYNVPEDEEGNVSANCPFCSEDEGKFGIHIDTGKWNCFKCETRGLKIKKLDEMLIDLSKGNIKERKPLPKKRVNKPTAKIKKTEKDVKEMVKTLQKDKDRGKAARRHLYKERGFSKNTVRHFKLGALERFGKNYMSVPTFEDGKLVNIKYRTVEAPPEEPKEFKRWKKFKWLREKNGKSGLFHDKPLLDKEKTLLITEAELDTICLYNAGFKNSVSVTVGAKGFKTDWYDQFQHAEKIYICFDNDTAGRKGAEAMAQRLGFQRCRVVELPEDVNDVNDFFWNKDQERENYSADEFKDLLKSAKKVSIDEVRSLNEVLRSVETDIINGDDYDTHYITPPWPRIAKKWGGFMLGHMIIVAGLPKSGKSSLLLNWSYHLATAGLPVFFICCEMRDKALAKRLIAINRKDFISDELITQEQVKSSRVSMPSDDFHFWYPSLSALRDIKQIEKMIRVVVERHGCKIIVFDNIQFAARDENGNTSEKTGQLSRMFKSLAEELNCAIFVVSQPRKINGKKEMDEQDLKDSSSLFQDLDHLFILNHVAQDDDPLEEDDFSDDEEIFKTDLNHMRSIKIISRWFESSKHMLYYNGARSIFKDSGRALDRMRKKLEDAK